MIATRITCQCFIEPIPVDALDYVRMDFQQGTQYRASLEHLFCKIKNNPSLILVTGCRIYFGSRVVKQ
jgi:hypothetical protein